MLPLITRLDPPFRSVIWGGGPAGPVRPVGSVPTLYPNVHLKPAAEGWRNKVGGRRPRTGQNTASATTPRAERCTERIRAHSTFPADSGTPTHFLKDIGTHTGRGASGQRGVTAPDTFAAD